jgi:hypothetical protein
MQDQRPMRYGDFPRLFEGFPPDEEVDLWDTRTILRLMALARRAEAGAAAEPDRDASADPGQLAIQG